MKAKLLGMLVVFGILTGLPAASALALNAEIVPRPISVSYDASASVNGRETSHSGTITLTGANLDCAGGGDLGTGGLYQYHCV